MIDLHTHSILSDGELIPSELVRRAYVAGYKAIAITDHVDGSNIEFVLSGLVKVSKDLNKYWDIRVLPGVEITHVPLEVFPKLVSCARKMGARIVVGHGESPVEPVLAGTNRAAIMAGVDILAHPGWISKKDAQLAADKGVYLEITTRRGHANTNKHVFDTAIMTGAKMVLDTDSHSPEDLLTGELIKKAMKPLKASNRAISDILRNAEILVSKNLKSGSRKI